MTTLIVAQTARRAERYRAFAGIDRRETRTVLRPSEFEAATPAATRIVLVNGWSHRRPSTETHRILDLVAACRAEGAQVDRVDLNADIAFRVRPRDAIWA